MRVVGAINSGLGMRGAQRSDAAWSLTKTITPRLISSGGTTEVTIKDSIYDQNSGASYAQDGIINVVGANTYGATFNALTPSIATVDVNGAVTVITDGVAEFEVQIGQFARSISWNAVLYEGEVVKIFDRFVTGSVAHAATTTIDTALVGANPSTDKTVFSVMNSSTLTRNPDLWISGYVNQLTAISPWNSYNSNFRAGTAITRRHLAMAWHFPTVNGTVFKFVEANGTVHERTQIGTSYSLQSIDRLVVTLDSDLPLGITPAKVLPANYLTYLPYYDTTNISQNRVPLLMLDQDENALVTDLSSLRFFDFTSNFLTHRTPISANRLAFNEGLIGGDSGNPIFMLLNNEAVLCACHMGTTIGPVWCADSAIASLILAADANAGVSTGYSVTAPTWGGYTTY